MTWVTLGSLSSKQNETVTGFFPIGQCWGRWLLERQPAAFRGGEHLSAQGCRPARSWWGSSVRPAVLSCRAAGAGASDFLPLSISPGPVVEERAGRRDGFLHAEMAHVAERHRIAGWVLRLGHIRRCVSAAAYGLSSS